jgi:hypothetical protein
MKSLLVLTSLLLSFSLFADQEPLLLDQPTVRYGSLIQDPGYSAFETVEIKRTAQTPAQVTFKYGLETVRNECVQWDTVRTWRPGYSSVRCTTDSMGRQHCTTVWVPGYYDVETICVRTARVVSVEENEIVLDFRRADRLSGNAFEIFAIDFDQRRVSSDRVRISGRAVSTARNYSISTSMFGKRLKFQTR